MNSKNGFQTKVWGAPAWFFLHMISLNYNPLNSKEYKLFFETLQYVLPCGACKTNYAKLLINYPITNDVLKTRESFAYWLFGIHNHVQTEIYTKSLDIKNKPKYNTSKKHFYKMAKQYEINRANCSKTKYGCYEPKNGGIRLQSKVKIIRFNQNRKYKPAIRTHL